MKQTFQESFEVAVGSSDFHIITQKDKWDAYVPISYATAFYKYLISRLIYAWIYEWKTKMCGKEKGSGQRGVEEGG